jgi:hypothetical protein
VNINNFFDHEKELPIEQLSKSVEIKLTPSTSIAEDSIHQDITEELFTHKLMQAELASWQDRYSA